MHRYFASNAWCRMDTEQILRKVTLFTTALFLITILMLFAGLQGLGELDLYGTLFLASVIFHPISLILILLSCLRILKENHQLIVVGVVSINLILWLSRTVLILASVIKGDVIIPVAFSIPSVLFLTYYFVKNKSM